MKRVLFIFAIWGLTAAVAFGQISRENREVSEFTRIAASSVFNITVHRGDVHSLVIEADAVVMPYVRSVVYGNHLLLSIDGRFGDRYVGTLNATIVMPNLERVNLSGTSRLTAVDLFTPDNFEFTGNGSNSLSVNLNTNSLLINVGGAGNIEINANVSRAAFFIVNGAGNISGNLVTDRVTFDYQGVGNVTLTGSATQGTINAAGVPTMNLVDFPIREATVNAPGVANITVNATHSLRINASGVSTVRYTGTATVLERNVSRVSNVSRL